MQGATCNAFSIPSGRISPCLLSRAKYKHMCYTTFGLTVMGDPHYHYSQFKYIFCCNTCLAFSIHPSPINAHVHNGPTKPAEWAAANQAPHRHASGGATGWRPNN